MKWTDVYDIAIMLEESHPDVDVMSVKFTDLMVMVMQLHGFDDDRKHCNEKILEAIQMAWMDEKN